MVICHSIAQADELTYSKFLLKMRQCLAENPGDKVAKRSINLLDGVPFIEVKAMTVVRAMRLSMNDALNFAIEAKREIIAFDIVAYSKVSRFTLQVEEVQM